MSPHTLTAYRKKGWTFIGSGAYGTVLAAPSGQLVVKKAANDGTRTYLEWVIAKTLKGEFMQGMPWIESLTDVGRGRYVVVMRRYERKDYEWYEERKLSPHTYNSECPAYLRALVLAFEADTGIEASDLGSNNVLYDRETDSLILTDPSGGPYSRSSATQL